MTYWDSSAVVTLLVEQPFSGQLLRLASTRSGMFTWWGTKVECVSALMRLSRDGFVSDAETDEAMRSLDMLLKGCTEVQPVEDVRRTSVRLLRVHPLRSADSLQLAAALVACQHQPTKIAFVCLDTRLRTAASREGFRVLPESVAG